VVDAWNARAELPRVESVSHSRRKRLRELLDDPGRRDLWRRALEVVARTPCARRKGFDWFLRSRTVVQAVEIGFKPKPGEEDLERAERERAARQAQMDDLRRRMAEQDAGAVSDLNLNDRRRQQKGTSS
jgi:hypothetical protein